MHFGLLTESVTDVWLAWFIAILTFTFGIKRIVQVPHWRNLGRFFQDESGASYTLPYVLTFPIYLLTICIMIQSTLILLVKCGNTYAAYAAARAAVVWHPADPQDADASRAHAQLYSGRAAILAMTPFSSGNVQHRRRLFPFFPFALPADHPLRQDRTLMFSDPQLFDIAYRRFGRRNATSGEGTSNIITDPDALADRQYLRNKYLYAAAATETIIHDRRVQTWNKDVKVTVKHRMPIHIPGTGRILGRSTGGFFFPEMFFRDIETTVSLTSEAAQTATGRLNVPYNPEFSK